MENCELCNITTKEEYRIIKENKHAFSCIILEPLTESHLLIIPKRHVINLKELNAEEAKDYLTLLNEMSLLLQERFNISGGLTLMNHGINSSQKHIHFHTLATKLGVRDLLSQALNVPSRQKRNPEELIKLVNNIKQNL